jgi:hypothetical protein
MTSPALAESSLNYDCIASNSTREAIMKTAARSLSVALLLSLFAAIPASAQIYKYYTPGSVWTVTTIRIAAGMDQAYQAYLDGPFKKETDALVKAGYMKSYKILKSDDFDSSSWNLIILREYASMASIEATAAKSDSLSATIAGNDQTQMQGYTDRSKIRELLGTKTMRELILK